MIFSTARVLVPIVMALVVGGLILLVLGKDPFAYYEYVVRRGLLSWSGFQQTVIRSAPLLLIANLSFRHRLSHSWRRLRLCVAV